MSRDEESIYESMEFIRSLGEVSSSERDPHLDYLVSFWIGFYSDRNADSVDPHEFGFTVDEARKRGESLSRELEVYEH